MDSTNRGHVVEQTCVFCRIIGGEEMVSLIHEDDLTLAFLDINPVSRGHALIVTREHHPQIWNVPQALLMHCLDVSRRIAAGIKKSTGAPSVNVFCADGVDGGQDVPHFHLHLIPVAKGEVFPLQLPPSGTPVPSRSELDVTAARIGRAIQEVVVGSRP
jgi:histidine triad (HIT) family protein